MIGTGTEESPIYRKRRQGTGVGTALFLIECDEGWRSTIVCADMYEWVADWLLELLSRQPFAPGRRP